MMHINNDLITIGDQKSASLNIIWFHGYGSNNWSFEPTLKLLNMKLNDSIFIVLPNAPYDGEKRSWYPLPKASHSKNTIVEDFEGLKKSLELTKDLIVSLSLSGNQKLVVGGFSQGAALSLSLAFSEDITMDGCIVLSGYMPCINEFKDSLIKTKELFIAHGYQDNAIEYSAYEKTLSFLRTKELNIINKEGDFGHTVTKEIINDLECWLLDILNK